jgi:hypothetical protein
MDTNYSHDDRLTRQQLSARLTAAGYPTAVSTLATLATRGGGPAFQKYGSRPLYLWGPSLAWAKARLSKPVRSTSELWAA